jgi:tRNA threonylcarbamoyladenosine modification (KEOPS) complex  Pcc1 subunit
MYEAELRIECDNPDLIKKSLEPDVKDTKDSQSVMEAGKNLIVIRIKSEKLSHLKAIINSYISLIDMLKKV